MLVCLLRRRAAQWAGLVWAPSSRNSVRLSSACHVASAQLMQGEQSCHSLFVLIVLFACSNPVFSRPNSARPPLCSSCHHLEAATFSELARCDIVSKLVVYSAFSSRQMAESEQQLQRLAAICHNCQVHYLLHEYTRCHAHFQGCGSTREIVCANQDCSIFWRKYKVWEITVRMRKSLTFVPG